MGSLLASGAAMCGANSNEIAIARREEKTTTRIPYSCDDECSSISDDPAIVAGLQRWCLDVSEWDELSPEQWNLLLSLLPEAESARVKRFVRENDRRLALGSRLLQRAVVSKVFGLDFSDVGIGRTKENKPYFAGMRSSLLDGTASSRLRNWNFNVSHHGKYVAIASEPICLCGVDVVDTTGRRRNDDGPAEDYLRYFTDHFTDQEWEAIRCNNDGDEYLLNSDDQTADKHTSRPADDKGRLRRFFLNWGLKESYVKAVGQGLGFDLRRISFTRGSWLECCTATTTAVANANTRLSNEQSSACQVQMTTGDGTKSSCDVRVIDETGDMGMTAKGVVPPGGGAGKEGRESSEGCTCCVGVAEVEVDGLLRTDWSFRVFPLGDGFAACVARGPPSACSASGRAVGVVSDPSVGIDEGRNTGEGVLELEQGLALPQLNFTAVRLGDILPEKALAELGWLAMTAGGENESKRERGGLRSLGVEAGECNACEGERRR